MIVVIVVKVHLFWMAVNVFVLKGHLKIKIINAFLVWQSVMNALVV